MMIKVSAYGAIEKCGTRDIRFLKVVEFDCNGGDRGSDNTIPDKLISMVKIQELNFNE